ncbi:hypothetical protein H072_4458 [Dactylellina haptotyla CBS 200.50]|uniref:Mannosyltransferase n=1 Tax=Dactylellina haptotyla (strain CBS 200.50) TaxID=1284197 RepID=S8BQA2_DACHA|nr:hypothetical protein H072_4458 [Dactylellina haptotyla CBS 200.50]
MSTNAVSGPHSKPSTGKSSKERSRYLHYNVALSLTFLVGMVSATFAIIPDCDEVFNYWEPTHYISYGSGLQTWEYSPLYAIRSWLYVGLHSLAVLPFSILAGLDKKHEFIIIRGILAAISSLAQTELYDSLCTVVGPDIGFFFLLILVPSAGMFQAVPAYLPSSFAMYFVMFGMATFLKNSRDLGKALVFFSVAGLWGWPFSIALIIPQLGLWVFEGIYQGGVYWVLRNSLQSIRGPLVVLATITLVDSIAYRKIVLVPLNIVLYNVFGGEGRGPDLYGTEPWWYYLANLSLNFNIMTGFALSSIFFQALGMIAWPTSTNRHQLVLQFPFYLWLSIFTMQPHKEERFMFPAYPALCLNAAISMFWVKHVISQIMRTLKSNISGETWGTVAVFCISSVAALISILRITAINTAYSAPMGIYNFDRDLTLDGNVCFGKEWYRFPSSYFLSESARPRFIKSSFSGLLPGTFSESDFGFRTGTWRIPENMNDLNQEDPSKYVPIDSCNYLVDSYYRDKKETSLEPNYILDIENWEQVSCKPFLDAAQTPFLDYFT